MDHGELARLVERTWGEGRQRAAFLPGGLGEVSIGFEERTARDRYDWQGAQRGPQQYVVVQYTLAGWGAFTDVDGHTTRVDPGMVFTAWIPTAHRYFLPRESPVWRFFFLIFRHPYAVQRLGETLGRGHPVQVAGPAEPFTASLTRLWSAVRRGALADDLALERGVLDLVLEHDRLVRDRRPGQDERERLLAGVRGHLAAHPGQVVEVADLAAAAGMSRSAWAHQFAKRTGLSPARYIAQLRLDEVRRALLEGDEPLAALAGRTGFADANHLCKAFRRHFHQSPGQYRRQMGG